MSNSYSSPKGIAKSATGIPGFDEMTGGGMPSGCTTLVAGEAGAGKTIFALQSLVGGARDHEEPGIFVAFEEQSERIITNAAQFGWDLPGLQKQGLFFLDAQPDPRMLRTGDFGIEGLLSRLESKIRETGTKRIAFDAIDVILALIEKPSERQHELLSLHNWLVRNNLTAVITAKAGEAATLPAATRLDFMQFMVDCYIRLHHDCFSGISQRSLRIVKYRGTAFEENRTPLIFGKHGMDIAYAEGSRHVDSPVSTDRVSTGVDRLDTMLDGGYHRGSSILITGSPGTAKTTLGAAFAAAACNRGEHTVLVTFDSSADEVVRNIRSVGIDLEGPRKQGTLQIQSARTIYGNAEAHVMNVCRGVEAHAARCLVVDPLSALAGQGNDGWSKSIVERLVDWCKSRGITLLCTSLLNQKVPDAESTPLQISTIADTWIHLNYLIHGGERNRGLTIVKSRGTSHSNRLY